MSADTLKKEGKTEFLSGCQNINVQHAIRILSMLMIDVSYDVKRQTELPNEVEREARRKRDHAPASVYCHFQFFFSFRFVFRNIIL